MASLIDGIRYVQKQNQGQRSHFVLVFSGRDMERVWFRVYWQVKVCTNLYARSTFDPGSISGHNETPN